MSADEPRGEIDQRRAQYSSLLYILIPVIIVLITHVLNPIIVNLMGHQLGPWGLHFDYIENRGRAYDKAIEMIEKAAKNKESHIINFRSTKSNPEQDRLYRKIVEVVSTSGLQYTRVIAYDVDPGFSNTRWFLEHLGDNARFQLIVTVPLVGFPSCVLTDKAAIIGFNDCFDMLNRALYVDEPRQMVEDVKSMYTNVIQTGRHSVTFKSFGEKISAREVDERMTEKTNELEELIRNSKL